MSEHDAIKFQDGARYEAMMGTWSRLAGTPFLDWLAPDAGQRWLDVGCGNGAFTQLLVERVLPKHVTGVDPSIPQIEYARSRGLGPLAAFDEGVAERLPVAAASFDVAVMALVIYFVSNPAAAVSAAVRAVRRGGTVCAYAWDMQGGGFPLAPVHDEMRRLGVEPQLPPSVSASGQEEMERLWTEAGLSHVRSTSFKVRRTFRSFDDYWYTSLNSVTRDGRVEIPGMGQGDVERLRDQVRQRLPPDHEGSVAFVATTNAIAGVVPG